MGYREVILADSPVNYWRLGDGVDPYYANVSFLLPMHGDNNGTSFVDQSPTPKTVSVYGDVKTMTSSYKYYGSSAYFDGTGDYLTVPRDSAFEFGSGDFTIELWLKPVSSFADWRSIISSWPNSLAGSWRLLYGIDGKTNFGFMDDTNTNRGFSVTTAPMVLGTWYHLALVRSGTTFYFFLNGVLITTATVSQSIPSKAGAVVTIGRNEEATTWYAYANFQDVRVTKGVARYTENFTPPSRLSRWAIDEMNQHHLTWTGTPVYGAARAIVSDTDTSMSLDGSTEYASKAVSDFRGSDMQGSFEAWCYFQSDAANIFSACQGVTSNGRFLVYRRNDSGGHIAITYSTNNASSAVQTVATFPTGQYYHVVVTTDGSTWKVYVDGVEQSLTVIVGSNNGNWFGDIIETTNYIYIGAQNIGTIAANYLGSIDEVAIYNYPLSATQVLAHYDAGVAAALLRAVLDQPYSLLATLIRATLDQDYHLTTRQINTIIQVYGLKMLATLIQPYGNMPQFRNRLDQRYGDCNFLRRLIEWEYGDAPQYRAELAQEWNMPEALRAMLVQRYYIAEAQLRGLCEQVYDLSERDLVKAILDQLYVLAAGEAIVQSPNLAIVAETDGAATTITSAFNITVEQDDAIYHMVGELQLADQGDYLACRKLQRGVVPSAVAITIDGQAYSFIVEDKRAVRGTENTIYAVVLASPSLLLGHKDSPSSLVTESMLSGMAQAIVTALAGPVCSVDWQLVDWYIPPNRLYVNGRTAIEVIRQIVEAVGGKIQTSPSGVLICRPEYPVDVDKWASAAPAIELADQDNFFSIVPSSDPREGFNRFYLSDQQLGASGEQIDDEIVSSFERHVKVSYVPWAEAAGMRLHHSGGAWISIQDNGVVEEVVSEQVELVAGVGRVSNPAYGDAVATWLQSDLGGVTVVEDGTVTADIAENSLATISYTTRYYSFTLRGDRVEDVQVYSEVLS